MGAHVLMFVSHEAGEGQVKMAVRPPGSTAPEDGKKPFTASSEASKDWILNGETILTDYLLTSPVEEDSVEKQEVEISLDEDGNPELPTWGGQKLKVQQNLARAVFQATYGSLTGKWWGSSKKRVWVTVEDDSEAEVGGAGVPGPSVTRPSVVGTSGQTMDMGEVPGEATTDVGEQTPEESSPAWHASKDQIQYLKSLYHAQVPSTLGPGGCPARRGECKADRGGLSLLGNLDLECQVFTRGNSLRFGGFLEGNCRVAKCKVWFLLKGFGGGSGTWASVEECSHAQEVEEDDPVVSNLHFLVNSKLGVHRGDDVMDVVGVVVSRLEQCSTGTKEPQGGNGGEGLGGSDEGDEEKEAEEAPP
ncbi:hypothetical protein EDD16DRAFT_1516365 [Pisolithus croceorrhizus]|nr:hypothetical protein EDD16DRAFT_1516365 [Pisolithus croceorrhizus]